MLTGVRKFACFRDSKVPISDDEGKTLQNKYPKGTEIRR
jgi:hypothetical protein